MMQNTDELYSLLVPLNQARLIVPRACIAEVVRYAPEEPAREGLPWFRGFESWNDLRIPILSFEDLAGIESSPPGGRTRVAIFHAIGGKLETGYFGLLTEGFPQLVRVNREVMELCDQQHWPEEGPVICQIRMINEYPLIPDLEQVETMAQEYLDALDLA